ncbi:hypothetical protein TWF679_001253 [Orbilia oligospora]|uniref:Zn(2)-C6 fungal-type domain-containing protein n=1 Tax=Orbilia oligospora TaxID=2813651 RepID=A0A8H8UVT4_ORBOL|nr:hypothetical protein TWF679_001253 [Orbilia oligospora]KAF3199635.1 hypothetical protein TWF679_001253 [Orbilia oligospora]
MGSMSMEHRPYRSHKVPACARCRQRKIRCKVDLPNQPCLFCREKGVACQIPAITNSPDDSSPSQPSNSSNTTNTTTSSTNAQKRRRYDAEALSSTTSNLISISQSSGGIDGKSSIIVGPSVAEDVEIVQRHMSITPQSQSSHRHNSTTYATEDSLGSVVYVTVPKYRRGVTPKLDTGDKQREIVEQIFGPFKKEAIRLYFELIHPCFPIIGEELRLQLLGQQWNEVNSALLCNIYASIVPLWDRSEILRLHPRPDSDYIWNLAVRALQEDSTSPSFSTIFICAINVIGRPSLYYIGNIANSSRVVALSHSFGLHRDPRKWNKPLAEKEMRIKIWWCVFIIDCWSSLSYGTPPNIAKGCHDVRLPEIQLSTSSASSGSPRVTTTASTYLPLSSCSLSFYSLCSLTQILAEILPMVYHLDPDPRVLMETLQNTATMVRKWEESQSSELPPSPRRQPPVRDNASSNLHFCYLSVKLLFSRLSLRAAWLQQSHQHHNPANANPALIIHDCLVDLQLAATRVLEYVSNLTTQQLQEFWLPYTSHLLVVATMILLRCAVETENQAIKVACAATLISLKDNLESHRDKHGWELGELCLERCAELISRVQSTAPPTIVPVITPVVPTPTTVADEDAFQFLNDTSLMPFDPLGGFDAIDDIWQSLFGNVPPAVVEGTPVTGPSL